MRSRIITRPSSHTSFWAVSISVRRTPQEHPACSVFTLAGHDPRAPQYLGSCNASTCTMNFFSDVDPRALSCSNCSWVAPAGAAAFWAMRYAS
jgi:hypothetical protein